MAKKCQYYIMFPENKDDNVIVKCLAQKPEKSNYPSFAFAEGGFKTKDQVQNRLFQWNIPKSKAKWN